MIHGLRKDRYYISGAVSSDPDFREKFSKAEKELRAKGYKVLNPIKGEHDGKEWSHYMHKDIKKLLKCNGIIRLKDWAQSEGARLEYKIACTLGYKVLDFGEIV